MRRIRLQLTNELLERRSVADGSQVGVSLDPGKVPRLPKEACCLGGSEELHGSGEILLGPLLTIRRRESAVAPRSLRGNGIATRGLEHHDPRPRSAGNGLLGDGRDRSVLAG